VHDGGGRIFPAAKLRRRELFRQSTFRAQLHTMTLTPCAPSRTRPVAGWPPRSVHSSTKGAFYADGRFPRTRD